MALTALTLPLLNPTQFDDSIAEVDIDTDAELAVIVDALHTQLNAIALAVNQLTAAVVTLDKRTRHPLLEHRNQAIQNGAF